MTNGSSITAIVLAAGCSKRMGRFKPLLPLGPYRTIERVVHTFQSAGVGDILVVTGYRSADVVQAVSTCSVRCVRNARYMNGMFTSVLTGIQGVPANCRAFFIQPVDIPLVQSNTVKELIAAFGDTGPAILHPTFHGRRGHPPLIAASLIPGILMWSAGGGLRAFLKSHDAASAELAVDDEGILLDLDTPEDYQRIRARFLL